MKRREYTVEEMEDPKGTFSLFELYQRNTIAFETIAEELEKLNRTMLDLTTTEDGDE